MIGKRFGRLLVTREATHKDGRAYWHCKCDCGNEVDVSGKSLRRGYTKSCGCIKVVDLTGKLFGRLIVIEFSHIEKRQAYWKCRCSCGAEIVVRGNGLQCGGTQSCGCLNRDLITTHGMTGTRFYKIYQGIGQRCNNSNDIAYKYYGGRGIKCLWSSFENFKEDMYESYLDHVNEFGEDNTSIDRIDVNGNYCKENCKWSTQQEQANNKRNNHIVEVNGEILTVPEAARKYNINYSTIHTRLRNGRDIFGNVVL